MRLKTAPAVLAICALLALSGCSQQGGETVASNESSSSSAASTSASTDDNAATRQPETATVPAETQKEEAMNVTATLNGHDFEIELVDNDTARAFAGMLPLSGTLSELNGNEKYAALPTPLPVQASCPGQIQAGDVMLYGKDCLVLFYESFSTSYSYTPLGRLDDPQGLAQALGTGSVTVTLTASTS